MEQFGLMIDSEDTVNPPAVTGFLEDLRALQAPLVAKRDKELDFLTTIQPQDVTVPAFEAWISRVEAIQERVRNIFLYGKFIGRHRGQHYSGVRGDQLLVQAGDSAHSLKVKQHTHIQADYSGTYM